MNKRTKTLALVVTSVLLLFVFAQGEPGVTAAAGATGAESVTQYEAIGPPAPAATVLENASTSGLGQSSALSETFQMSELSVSLNALEPAVPFASSPDALVPGTLVPVLPVNPVGNPYLPEPTNEVTPAPEPVSPETPNGNRE
jgi:hypothetical protein